MYSRKEFEKLARDERPADLAERAVRFALLAHDQYAAKEHFYSNDLNDLFTLARTFAEEMPSGGPSVRLLPHTPLAELDTQRLLKPVAAAVRYVREKVFGSPNSPFPDDDVAAERWITEQAEAYERRFRDGSLPPAPWADLDRARDALEDAGHLVRYNTDYVTGKLYWRGSNGVIFIDARTGPLFEIRRAVWRLEFASGFEGYQLLRYTLTGVEPTFPRVRVMPRAIGMTVTVGPTPEVHDEETGESLGFRGPVFGRIQRDTVQVTIQAGDVTDEELRSVVRSVLGLLGGRERPRLTGNDLRLRRIVTEIGHDPTAPGAWSLTGFWAKVAVAWNEEADEALRPRALSDRYRRLLKRLDKLSQPGVVFRDPDTGDIRPTL